MKLHALCPACGVAVALAGRRIVRHTRRGHYDYRGVCEGTNTTATDDAVRAWLTGEAARADADAARVPELRARAEREHAKAVAYIDAQEREAAELRAWTARQLAKLGGGT